MPGCFVDRAITVAGDGLYASRGGGQTEMKAYASGLQR
jgi:hypothetical protein